MTSYKSMRKPGLVPKRLTSTRLMRVTAWTPSESSGSRHHWACRTHRDVEILHQEQLRAWSLDRDVPQQHLAGHVSDGPGGSVVRFGVDRAKPRGVGTARVGRRDVLSLGLQIELGWVQLRIPG